MIQRILAVFTARNLEFIRDRASLAWNLLVPVGLVLALGMIFSEEGRPRFTVGAISEYGMLAEDPHPFFATRFIEFLPAEAGAESVQKIGRHLLDLLVDTRSSPTRYWLNPDSPNGYIVERLLLQVDPGAERQIVTGRAVRYVDWLLPGVLGMNMMFSCLFGVGYVVVRYRKNGFLKRLRATPLSALEFILAQALSRLVIIMSATGIVFTGVTLLLGIAMAGSYLALAAVAVLGSMALISLALVVAARIDSEELASGLLNLLAWPMMLLSGVFYSLEGANEWLRALALILPLTHVLSAARAIMIDGAGLVDIGPQLLSLAGMATLFIGLAAALFKWRFN